MNRLYKAFLLLTIICCSIQAHAGQKLRVYFIGNSYTYFNDLPKMIADIATAMGDTLVYDSHTPGGWTLDDHWNPPADPCVGKIKTGNWDYVIMQEQSQMPAFGVLNPSHPTYIYAQQFTTLIRDSAKCTTPMFYMTWGYKNGDATNCPGLAYMCTYLTMDSVLRMRYLELADSFNAVVSPVGAVRRYIRQYYPGIELYQADGSHPEVAGTYAAACCFYSALFKKDPSLITFNSTVPAADAANIRTAAKKVAYDSLAAWGLGVYDLTAAYDQNIMGNQVSFTNQSSAKAQTYLWNFGDGNTSALKNPVHTYTAAGVYTVTLTSFDGNGCSKVTAKKISLFPDGIHDARQASFSITPNPATDHITVVPARQSDAYDIRITNAMGQTVYRATVHDGGEHQVDVSSFSSGVYYLLLHSAGGAYGHEQFVRQ